MLCQVDYAPRIIPSLVHAHLERVIRSIAIPDSSKAKAWIPDFTEVWEGVGKGGATQEVSIALKYNRFASLPQLRTAQLNVDVDGKPTHRLAVQLFPLYAWDMHNNVASATASLVLENSKTVSDVVNGAGLNGEPGSPGPHALDKAERAFAYLQRSFGLYYMLERQYLAPGVQAVRFPRQIVADGGGTCCDFAFLYCAVLRAAFVCPLVLILGQTNGERHAIAGIWVDEGYCQDQITIEPEEVESALNSGKMVAVDSTYIAKGNASVGFAAACRKAQEEIGQMGILYAVDINAARYSDPPVSSLPGVVVRRAGGEEAVSVSEPQPFADRETTLRAEEALGGVPDLELTVEYSIVDQDRGKRWPLKTVQVRIGRDSECEVTLHDPFVSRLHCLMLSSATGVYVQDAGSKNGTFVTGERLGPFDAPVAVREGDTIALGDPPKVVLRLLRYNQSGRPEETR